MGKIKNGIVKIKKDGLLKSSFLVMFLKGIGVILGYSLTYVISNSFGPVGYGIYSIAFTTMIVYSYVSSFGLTTSILRYIGQFSGPEGAYERRRLYTQALKIICFSSVILSLLLYVFSKQIAEHVFKDESYALTLKIVSVIAPFFTLNLINVEYLRGLNKIAISEIFRTVLVPLLCMIGIYLYANLDEQTPVYALGWTVIILGLSSFAIIITKIIKIKKSTSSTLSLDELLKTSAPMMLIALSSYFIGNISVYIIQIIETTSQVGIYALALKISLFISFILIGVNTVIAPKLSELYWKKKTEKLSQMIHSKTKFIFWLSVPVFIIIVLFSETIINFVNEEFISGAQVLIVLAIGQLINATCGPVGLLLNMTGHQKILMKVVLLVLILTLILNIVFVYQFGILGAAYATAISIAIKNAILVIVAKRKLNINTLYLPFIIRK